MNDEPTKQNEQDLHKSDEELFDEAVKKEKEVEGEQANDTHDAPNVETVAPEPSVQEQKPAEETIKPITEPAYTQKPVEAAAPMFTPAQPAAPVAAAPKSHNSAGLLVLEWVAYAFWLWFGIAMTWLVTSVINYYVAESRVESTGEWIAYPLAAVIVMLAVTLITDGLYAKHEPVPKTGGASVIMLIHAVIYILAMVGALITAVFALITLVINTGPMNSADGPKVALISSVVLAVMAGLMAARALLAGKRAHVRKIFWGIMTALAIGFLIACMAGPVVQANASKNDRLLESALPALANDISNYASENGKLPGTLAEVKASKYNYQKQEVQAIIEKNMVTYKPNVIPANSKYKTSSYNQSQTLYYQLCATFTTAKNPDYYYKTTSSSDSANGASYRTSIDTYAHEKGNVCYDLQAYGKSSYNYETGNAVNGVEIKPGTTSTP